MKLILEGVKLIYVFDGKPPELKLKTHQNRARIKEEARKKYEEAKKSEDIYGMRKYSSQLAKLDDEMIRESKELLEAMGIQVVQAPSEGEAEAAYLAKMNQEIFASASQDYDSLLFGTPNLLQNLTLARRRRTQYGWVDV